MFRDRYDAGRVLAARLKKYAGRSDVVVMALPPGGVPVGYEIAARLGAALDVFVVRRLVVPGQEVSMGSISTGGGIVLLEEIIRGLSVPDSTVEATFRQEAEQLVRQEHELRGRRAPINLRRKTVVLVDEGITTRSGVPPAIDMLRQAEPDGIVVALPVAPVRGFAAIQQRADDVICAVTPEHVFGVRAWYDDARGTSDDEIRWLLAAQDEATAIRL